MWGNLEGKRGELGKRVGWEKIAFSAGLRVQTEWVCQGEVTKWHFSVKEQRTKSLLSVLQWHSQLNYMELLTHDNLNLYGWQFHVVKLDKFWDFASDHGKIFACSIGYMFEVSLFLVNFANASSYLEVLNLSSPWNIWFFVFSLILIYSELQT